MASHGQYPPAHMVSNKHHHAPYGSTTVAVPGGAPAGTFSPGTKIQVGSHRVVIQKYLSEGGFAHVYLVKLPKPVDGTDQAVLKRVAVPDKDTLRGMRIEVETMKRLKGHRPIVTYIDSHASELHGGGYEVFLLMEFCNGGGLIDFMNTRLQHRLTEPEILNIFIDIAEGVACMHYLKPPLLHRDIKVENVLITARGSSKRFKLCDFGSAASPRSAPTTITECRLMDEDVQKHTTMQYRSPEMIDVYRKQPINEKSDIWALGVLLYKLCYYTTPFEDQGQLAILNASYRFPSHPVFSDRLKKLIASMLRENLHDRPNIYQVLKEGCAMQGRDVPVQDIYSGRSKSHGRTDSPQPKTQRVEQAPAVGAVFARAEPQKQVIPDVAPMRRGRPTASPAPTKAPQKPDASPMRKTEGDPFAALDSKAASKGFDELSSRFPTLDQFSLLHDQGAKFDFDVSSPISPTGNASSDLNQRVTARLADEAFASSQSEAPRPKPVSRTHSVTPVGHQAAVASPPLEPSLSKTLSAPSRPDISRAQSIISNNPELQAISSQSNSRYVSTGTMTATPPPEKYYRDVERPVHRDIPDYARASSATRQPEQSAGQWGDDEPRPALPQRISSYQQSAHERQPSSSRPSLEGGRPRADFLEPSARASPAPSRPRPASTNLEGTTLDFLREREAASRSSSRPPQAHSPYQEPADDSRGASSDIDFLRSLEDSERSKSSKRSSLTSLSGNKNILAGKFGDAFKRFEGSSPNNARNPSPQRDVARRDLTPIAGSEATDGRSDDGHVHEDEDRMTPEMRREMERLKLQEEEQRVEAAQAEYRKRVAAGNRGPPVPPKSIGGVSRAVSIQNRVQSLLNEDQKPSNIQRTAQGYGKYTDVPEAGNKPEKPLPGVPKKPLTVAKTRGDASQARGPSSTSSAPPALTSKPPAKPPAPKKPMHLNSLPTGQRSSSPQKPNRAQTSSEQLIGMDLPGQPVLEMTPKEKDDYLQDFSKRFPSLGSIEMVEREIGGQNGGSSR
ncbi:Ark- serine/threonine protein kinase [Fusarium torreyae]|uniref:non-specific serine/threonine protein kinase n=1 Tax=Fusarium torreyae TaxID=1237075 RepID=A0A9W8VGM7_9HYPO|nr:Ark- serine/threonine protein kinase [Fusarium torreyae]